MIFKSKLDTFISQYFYSLREKSLFLRENFSSLLALLLLGFLVGNVFGTFLNILRFLFFWDVFIIFLLIGLLEILNSNVYRAKNRLLFLGAPGTNRNRPVPNLRLPAAGAVAKGEHGNPARSVPAKNAVQFLNFFKIGLMIGFFVDAFKVGS